MTHQETLREPSSCEHGQFAVSAAVNRMEDTFPMAFHADIKIECTECGSKFRFLGLNGGISWKRPTVGVDGCELHCPIEPEGQPRLLAGPFTFEVLPKEGEHNG